MSWLNLSFIGVIVFVALVVLLGRAFCAWACETMSTLYILHRSPYSTPEMRTALRLAKPEDGVILAQDAVLALRSTPKEINIEEASRKNIRFYAIKADRDARSVKEIEGVKTIDYGDLVKLLSQYESTYS